MARLLMLLATLQGAFAFTPPLLCKSSPAGRTAVLTMKEEDGGSSKPKMKIDCAPIK
jgi:hypothetical protein